MSKVLNVDTMKNITEIIERIWVNPKCKYIFSEEFVNKLSKCAYFGKQDVKTNTGHIDIYELEDDDGNRIVFNFVSKKIEYHVSEDITVKGYVLKELHAQPVIDVKPPLESEKVVIIM